MKNIVNIKNNFSILFIVTIFTSLLIVSCQKKEQEVLPETESNEISMLTSTVKGGDWFDENTWQEKIIPMANSDVTITGSVVLNDSAECLNLMIDAGAQLILEKDALLKIKHHAVNEGKIFNNGTIILEDR